MKNVQLHKTFTRLSVAGIIFIAVYASSIDYIFTHDQLNALFSMFFLVLALNYLGMTSENIQREKRVRVVFKDGMNIVLYCVLSACYSFMLIHSGVSVIKTALIIIVALAFFNLIFILLHRTILLILFWVNLYLFVMMRVLSEMPGFSIDPLSRFNPFGGMIVHLII